MPPEILEKRAYNPKKADIWSLGVLLYRLLYNRYPFNAKNEFQMLEKIRKWKLAVGEGGSELAALLEGMLSKDPAGRFSILDVLDSKWIS
jgi:carbon catabolite-derepressing protein kinase